MADYTLAQARQYVAGKIHTLTDAPCHQYRRLVRSKEDLENLFSIHNEEDNRLIHGYQMARVATTNEPDTAEGVIDFTFHRVYRLLIEGYYGLDDSQATELTFQAFIETILDAFDSDPKLGGNCNMTWPMEVQAVRDGFYGGYGVHYCELVLLIRMRRDRIA